MWASCRILVVRKVIERLRKVKNEWRYTFILPYTLLVCRGTIIPVHLLTIRCGENLRLLMFFFSFWLTKSIQYPNSSPNLRPFRCFHTTQETHPRTASGCGLSLVIRHRTRTNYSEDVVTAAEAELLNVIASQTLQLIKKNKSVQKKLRA